MRLALSAMRLPSLRYFLFAICLYFLFLLVTAPAWVIVWAMPKLTSLPINVQDSRGSLWRGEFSGVSATLPAGQTVQLDQIQWRLKPLNLLRAEAAAQVEVSGPMLQGQGTVAKGVFGGIKLRDFSATAPASLLSLAVPALDIWKPGGTLNFKTADFSYAGVNSVGKASAVWQKASLALSAVKPLGEYNFVLDANNGALGYQLTTVSGALLLEGKGRWAEKNPPSFLGSARAQAKYTSQLSDLLRLFGPVDASGVVRLSYSPQTPTQ
ncbi:MAG: type II secretion system protein N [Burkholderiales bacterium]